MELEPIIVWTLILAVAVILLGFIFSPKDHHEVSTKIVQMGVYPVQTQESDENSVTFVALSKGLISIRRRNLMLSEGDTVCLVIHKYSDHVKIVERKGVMGCGIEMPYAGEVTISCIGQRWYAYRYESEVTGQWCTFEFTNVVGNEKSVQLRY